MLNIGRMGRGSEGYYLHSVARGVEDYYLGHGEAPGQWLGAGTRTLGLAEQVSAEQLTRVLGAEHPATGEVLSDHPARKVPGFDLTFRAPKSVSLLWGLSDEQTSEVVERAHDAAVTAAVGYLERHAVRSRRGAGGVEQVEVDGIVGAAFRHRTSRAGDPLLHTHVLVANLVRACDDGRWRTLDSRRLFTHARTAGFLYQAHLRAELTRALGVAWQPVTNGFADLADVPRNWIEAFSKRRAAIVAELQRRGEDSAAAAQVATLDTRHAKEQQPDEHDLRTGWRTEARRHGIDPGWWRDLVGHRSLAPPDVVGLRDRLITAEGLTDTTSTFSHKDVMRTIAEASLAGATVEDVEAVTRLLLDAGLRRGDVVRLAHHESGLAEVIRRADGRLVDASGDDARFTTRGLLLLEQACTTAAVGRGDEGAAVVNEQVLDAALRRRPTLGEDQRSMLMRLTRGGDGVAVVVGKAGTGKTFALDAARDAWEAAGIRVTGVTLAARAAIELQDSAGISSTTLTRLLGQVDDDRIGSPLRPGQVLVVDEAGMVGTRNLARLLDHAARQQVKVVLVGDPHQLPEIDAGGLFVALTRRLPTIELTENRRQPQRWEQATLDQLRHGDVEQAVVAYAQEGRLVSADTAEEIRERLVSDWWRTYDHLSAGSSIMVAVRRADVADLNARGRSRLAAAGRLKGPTLRVDGVEFQAGDRVMCLRNDFPCGLVNGLAATITRVRNDGMLEADRDDGGEVLIRHEYIEAGHLTHGYAITGHKAQGLTVEHAYVLGSQALYREWGYVAMSRGRHSNHLYVHTQADLEPDAHLVPPAIDPATAAIARLRRTRADQPLTDDTAARWRRLCVWLDRPDVRSQPQTAARRDATKQERDQIAALLQKLHREQAGLKGPAIRAAAREARSRVNNRVATLKRRLHRLEDEMQDLERRCDRLPSTEEIARVRQQLKQLDRTLVTRSRDRSVAALANPPDYLLTTIGTPPPDERGQARWFQAAYPIERYRLDWGITDRARPFGDPPTSARQRRAHAHAIAEVDRAMRPPERHVPRLRSRGLAR